MNLQKFEEKLSRSKYKTALKLLLDEGYLPSSLEAPHNGKVISFSAPRKPLVMYKMDTGTAYIPQPDKGYDMLRLSYQFKKFTEDYFKPIEKGRLERWIPFVIQYSHGILHGETLMDEEFGNWVHTVANERISRAFGYRTTSSAQFARNNGLQTAAIFFGDTYFALNNELIDTFILAYILLSEADRRNIWGDDLKVAFAIDPKWNVVPNYYFTMTRDTEAYRSELKRVRSSIDI